MDMKTVGLEGTDVRKSGLYSQYEMRGDVGKRGDPGLRSSFDLQNLQSQLRGFSNLLLRHASNSELNFYENSVGVSKPVPNIPQPLRLRTESTARRTST